MVEAPPQDRPQHRLHEGGIAAVRVRPSFELRQGQGPLGEHLEDQHRRTAAGDQRVHDGPGGVRPVAPEAGGTADRQGLATHSSPPPRRTSLASASRTEPGRVVGEQEPLLFHRVRSGLHGRDIAGVIAVTLLEGRPRVALPESLLLGPRERDEAAGEAGVVAPQEPGPGDVPSDIGAQRGPVQDRRHAADLVPIRIDLRDEAGDHLPDHRRLERHPTRKIGGAKVRAEVVVQEPIQQVVRERRAGDRGEAHRPVIGADQLTRGQEGIPARRRCRVVHDPVDQGDEQGPHRLGLRVRIVRQFEAVRRSDAGAEPAPPAAVGRAGEVIAADGRGQRDVPVGGGPHQVRRHPQAPELGRAERLEHLRARCPRRDTGRAGRTISGRVPCPRSRPTTARPRCPARTCRRRRRAGRTGS